MSEPGQKVLKVAGAATVLTGGGLVVLPEGASAATIQVTTEAELSAAITQANSAAGPDTIQIAAGTIYLNQALPTITDVLTITGAGYANTTIDGRDSYRIFYGGSGAQLVTISDLTLSNGYAQYGGALKMSGPSLVLDSVRLVDNAGYEGGALWWEPANYGDLTITDCTFHSNFAYYQGGAFYAAPGGAGSTIVISGSTFTDNSSYGSAGVGRIDGEGRAEILNSTFTGNEADEYGGALYVTGGDLYLEIDGSTFANNVVRGAEGGAIEAYNFSRMVIRNSVFSGNVAEASAGGAIYISGVYDGTLIQNSAFVYNDAYGNGGAIWADSPVEIEGSVFENNEGYVGGAINSSYDLRITNSTFAGNHSYDDGGALATYGYLTITQSTFAENVADTYAGAIMVWSGEATINNSTIADNTSMNGGGGLYLSDSIDSVELNNTIVSGNSTDGAPNDIQSSYAVDIAGNNNLITVVVPDAPTTSGVVKPFAGEITLTGTGNILGVDAMLGELGDNGGNTETILPLPGSPAFDAGDNSVSPGATDQRGAARILDVIDIGAVEATAEERGESLPPTGSGAEQAAWYAALLSGVGAVLTLGASRRRQQQS